MNQQDFLGVCQEIFKQGNIALKSVFSEKIEGDFLLEIMHGVLKTLGLDNLLKYYDLRHSWE